MDSLRERIRDSLEASDDGVDEAAYAKLVTARALRRRRLPRAEDVRRAAQALGDAAHPLHYLALPPSLFATVADELRESGCADGASVVVEKPFGRDLASATSS